MVAQEEIVKLSQAKAAEIIAAAQGKSREMRKAAQDFVDDIMRRADEGLTAFEILENYYGNDIELPEDGPETAHRR